MLPRRKFWKMTGSGNDFVFFDAREEPPGEFASPAAIGAICDRRLGVGADGVVFLERDPGLAFSIRYFNRDGSLAELCGNASLCSVTLAAELGLVRPEADFQFGTSSGPLTGRLSRSGPEIDTAPVREEELAYGASLEPGEVQIGYARVGVPHLVIRCRDLGAVDVPVRGRRLRYHEGLPAGANANFVAETAAGWAMRTYERGVEEETLACGTGAVATAALLTRWGLAESPVRLATRSGAPLEVRFRTLAGEWLPSLHGEGRLVFEGVLRNAASG
ncbi:MAG TPA: diaminopimelate epimerase [Gemmatimonadaceae bacterium]|nr:diaminopimelate epimerase [Gemmatimonadaceae bacterium]